MDPEHMGRMELIREVEALRAALTSITQVHLITDAWMIAGNALRIDCVEAR